MDTKLLRQKILDLAIHGKLVPQDPNDEPASVLLENIKVEKEHLIKKGVIKSNIKSSISDNSIKLKAPFQIPISWKWCIISDIAYVASGSTPAKDAFVDSGIPYIKMYNLRDQKIDFEYKPQYIKSEVHNGQLKRSRTKIGDLIMNIVGPPLGKLAIIPKSLPECNFNQAAVLIRPLLHKDIISKYLFYYLSEMSEINSIITRGTAGQVNISLTQSQNMRVAIPPLEEMGKIVNKLDVFFNAIDKLEKNQKELKSIVIQLKSKILNIAMLGKLVPQDPNDEPASELLKRFNPKAKITSATSHYPFKIPNYWLTVKIGDIFDHNTGKTLNINNKEGLLKDYITTSNLYWNKFDLSFTRKMYFKESEINKYSATKGDLLICEGGDFGRAAIWRYDYNVCFQNHIHRLRPLGLLSVEFYFYIFYLYKKANLLEGKGIAIQGLSSSALHELMVPLPPYNEQLRIVSKIKELFAKIDVIQNSLEQ
jgi:type I restriction enzyme S subunit